jgi:predicted phosphoadenosine phosphosulfate sulfurtransferase
MSNALQMQPPTNGFGFGLGGNRPVRSKVHQYIEQWKQRGYPCDISDEAPAALERGLLAPSYRQIAHAILKNDHGLQTLGYAAPESRWYTELKRIEISMRPNAGPLQLDFWR